MVVTPLSTIKLNLSLDLLALVSLSFFISNPTKNTKTIESLLENLVNTNTESMEEGHKLPSQSGQNKPLEREIDLPENRGEQDKVEGIYYID